MVLLEIGKLYNHLGVKDKKNRYACNHVVLITTDNCASLRIGLHIVGKTFMVVGMLCIIHITDRRNRLISGVIEPIVYKPLLRVH